MLNLCPFIRNMCTIHLGSQEKKRSSFGCNESEIGKHSSILAVEKQTLINNCK